MIRSALRRAGVAAACTGVAAGAVLALSAPANAATLGRTVQVGPTTGIQCVTAYATHSVYGYGTVSSGSGANMQLRYSGYQIFGSGQQVSAFAAQTGNGLPGWFGPGYYEFCARNNGSAATVYISITAS